MAGSNSQDDPFSYRPLKRSKLSLKQRRNKNNNQPKQTAAEDSRQLKLLAVGQQSQQVQQNVGQNCSAVAGPSQKLLRLQEHYLRSFLYGTFRSLLHMRRKHY
jgi:hypothetical protein